jgi:hypothetical protein
MVWRDLASARAIGEIYERFTMYDDFRPFLAYQLAFDIAYTPLTIATEDDFMVPGTGALDGVAKCFPESSRHDATRIIYDGCAEQDEWFQRYSIAYPGLLGRRLRPIDCQNVFCEISKYARVAHPTAVGSLGRTPIKQTYQRNPGRCQTSFFRQSGALRLTTWRQFERFRAKASRSIRDSGSVRTPDRTAGPSLEVYTPVGSGAAASPKSEVRQCAASYCSTMDRGMRPRSDTSIP